VSAMLMSRLARPRRRSACERASVAGFSSRRTGLARAGNGGDDLVAASIRRIRLFGVGDDQIASGAIATTPSGVSAAPRVAGGAPEKPFVRVPAIVVTPGGESTRSMTLLFESAK